MSSSVDLTDFGKEFQAIADLCLNDSFAFHSFQWIRHFHISHNKPYLPPPPKKLYQHSLQFVCNSKGENHLFFLHTVWLTTVTFRVLKYKETKKETKVGGARSFRWITSWIGLLLTVTDVSTTCMVEIFRVKVSCITSVDGIKL